MGISFNEKSKLRVLQQLRRRKTYGNATYKLIADSIGMKYSTVKYIAKLLMEEGRINLSEYTPDDGSNPSEVQNESLSTEQLNAIGNISIEAQRDYIRKMLKGNTSRSKVIIYSFIDYCRKNINSKNLTSEDFRLLDELIRSDVNLMTAENIKLGILGFIRINKIGEARKFFEQCSLTIRKNLNVAMCTKEELDEIRKELDDNEERLKVYQKLKYGYPVEVIMEDTKLSEYQVRKMERDIKDARQAERDKKAKNSSDIEH